MIIPKGQERPKLTPAKRAKMIADLKKAVGGGSTGKIRRAKRQTKAKGGPKPAPVPAP